MLTIEIFLAIFIFILLVLVSIEDASTGFLLLLMLIPLQHKELFSLVFWDVIPIRIAFFGILLTTFYRFYLWFRRYKKKNQIIKFLKDPVLITLVALYIIRVISIFFSQNYLAGVKLLAFYTTIVYFYILIKHLYQSKGFSFLDKSIWLYSILGTVTGFIALVQFFAFKIYDIKFGAIWDIPGHNPRVGSTFWDVNHYGAFVASIIPLSLSFIFYKQKKASKLFWLFNTVFLAIILYLTQSRSAWLGLAVSSVVYLLFIYLKGYKKYARWLFLFGLCMLIALLSYMQFFRGGVVDYYKSFMHTRLDSFDTHFILVRGAYDAYSSKPLIGYGYGNFNEAFRETDFAESYFFRERTLVDKRVPSHSIWGEVLAETGFVGLVLFSLIFVFSLGFMAKGFFTNKTNKSFLSLGAFSAVLALMVSGIFYTYNLEFFYFILFLGTALSFYLNGGVKTKELFSYFFNIKKLPLVILSIFSFVLLFWDLGKNRLIDWDEAIYAKISSNIVEGGNYLTLFWNLGGNPWFEKPPLYMWASAFFMNLFGISELSARLPSAILGFVGVITVYYFAKYLFKSRLAGFVAGIMLLTTAHYWYYSRMSMIDVSVTAFITLSLYFAYKYLNTKHIKFAFLSGAFTGFAVMTKAIVGLLPVPIIFIYLVYLLINKNLDLNNAIKGIGLFVVSFLLVALPWHLVMYLKYGAQFTSVYIGEHIVGRGLTDAQGKTQPFFWYIDVLRLSFRGWFVILIPSFLYLLFKVYKNNKKAVFLLIYALVIFLFFSASKSKLIWYIIPLYPALVLINAWFIKDTVLYFYNKVLPKIKLVKSINYVVYSTIFALVFFYSSFLYLQEVDDFVYYPDFNKDLVTVIEAYNEKYVESPSTVKRLYYMRIASPVVKFYAKGQIIQSDITPFTTEVEKVPFDESLAYISRQGEVEYFVNLLGDDRVVPSYNAGAYSLMYVRSLEEFYLFKIQEVQALIASKTTDYEQAVSVVEKQQIQGEINQLYSELYNYQQQLYQNKPTKYTKPVLFQVY